MPPRVVNESDLDPVVVGENDLDQVKSTDNESKLRMAGQMFLGGPLAMLEPTIPSRMGRAFIGMKQPQPQNILQSGADFMGENALPAILAAGGAEIGGPLGSGAGGAIGTAIQEGARSIAARAGLQDVQSPTFGDATRRVGASALGNAAFSGAGNLLTKLRGPASTVAAQVMRAAAGIPEKYGTAAVADPAKLAGALSPQTVSEAYQAFERYTGLKGLGALEVAAEKEFSSGDLWNKLFKSANKVARGEEVPAQELYTASQAAGDLERRARYGMSDTYLRRSAEINQAKNLADSALEKMFPEYKNLRQDYFWSKAKKQFGSLLPLNKNQTPNALRAALATHAAATSAGAAIGALVDGREGAVVGGVLGMGAPLAISPALYGLALRGAAYGAKALPAATFAGRAALQGILSNYQVAPAEAR